MDGVNLFSPGHGTFLEGAQLLLALLGAPLLAGWVGAVRAVLSNRSPAGILQPWRDLARLFRKETLLPEGTSFLFRAVPYVVFGTLAASTLFIPFLNTDPPLAPVADAVVLVGLFSLARMMMAFGAMDAGTPFGDLGGRREMMVGFLAEPATLMILFTASLWSRSTSLPAIIHSFLDSADPFHPSLLFALLAFILVFLAENGRLPIDNPATHLELTMIHEAMILEYSGPLLAMMEWAAQLKLLLYLLIGIDFFFPAGLPGVLSPGALAGGILILSLKLLVAGGALAVIETLFAKLRIFRVPEFTALAYLLASMGFLIHFVLEV
ncbi:MAG: NADH-quinone oxidoreductase subunit H [Nitrospirae bacterium]|nr:NADH-quinone oxidoreductase subunit H [Nitrospirota bacterium]MCL5285291.1 NADH-quinone oxidoreductase subunit H [Nitrospirota bacterium]